MHFKSKLISTAVMTALGVTAGAAHAVNLGADGQGQVLIYPYFTVQTKGSNPYDTYISVVNSDNVRGKAVKVRFLEGKNSREVLDFNLYLSPNDVWTGAITRNADGNAIVRTWDRSCTAPEIPVIDAASGMREQAFVNYAYTGDLDDAAEDGLSRAREGYVEVIQMADLVSGQTTSAGLDTYAAAKHSAGTPANCAAIRAAWVSNDYANNDGVTVPTGGLSGTGTIINPGEGTDVTYDVVAIENFSATALHEAPGSIAPNLAQVNPKTSYVFEGGRIVETQWAADIGLLSPAAPVSALLMRNQIVSEYAMMAAPVGLSTDWVITMPTKSLHLDNYDGSDINTIKPFTQLFGSNGACEQIGLVAYNREEGVQASGLIFSPPPPQGVNTLCWEANVVSMVGGGVTSNALGSLNLRQTLPVPYTEGWLRMSFAQTMATVDSSNFTTPLGGARVAVGDTTYTGLPIVGFVGQTFVNTSTLANYGGSFTHRYTRSVVSAAP